MCAVGLRFFMVKCFFVYIRVIRGQINTPSSLRSLRKSLRPWREKMFVAMRVYRFAAWKVISCAAIFVILWHESGKIRRIDYRWI